MKKYFKQAFEKVYEKIFKDTINKSDVSTPILEAIVLLESEGYMVISKDVFKNGLIGTYDDIILYEEKKD